MRLQRWQPPPDLAVADRRTDPRASLRSWGLRAASAGTLRPLVAVLPMSELGVWLARRVVAGTLAVLSSPLTGTDVRVVDEPADGELWVRGEGVRRQDTPVTDAAILYLHGSGYALCSARTHRGLTSRLAAESGVPVFAADYRLAPRHRFAAAADDVRAAYDWLISR